MRGECQGMQKAGGKRPEGGNVREKSVRGECPSPTIPNIHSLLVALFAKKIHCGYAVFRITDLTVKP